MYLNLQPHRAVIHAIARHLVCTGGKIYVACRSLERAQHAVDDIVKQTGVSPSQLPIMQLDLASFKSIRSFASSFRESQLTGLILLLMSLLFTGSFYGGLGFGAAGWVT